MNKGLREILILCLLGFTSITSCAIEENSNESRSSIIEKDECSPPCWKNITPGKTTRQEVVQILNDISWIDKDSIKSNISGNYGGFLAGWDLDCIQWLGKLDSGDYSGRVCFYNDTVAFIEISLNEGVIDFSDLIKKLGIPESVLIIKTEGAERDTLSIHVLYTSKGYAFLDYYTTLNLKNPIQIAPDDDVQVVWYFVPEYHFELLKFGHIGNFSSHIIEKGLQDWKGYGEYQFTSWDMLPNE